MSRFSLTVSGRMLRVDRPLIMAIINATDDSFYSCSRACNPAEIADAAKRAIEQGADIIDIGACSTRPGARIVDEETETRRLCEAVQVIRSVSAEIPISVDTFRSSVAEKCITDFGADIVNDVSGGNLDEHMFETVAALKAPYILTHMRGTPSTMQSLCDYPQGVVAEVIAELSKKIERLSLLGVCDIIVDPGFGLAKTLEDNYTILANLKAFKMLDRPILAGLSRKSMLSRLLDVPTNSPECLEATVAVNMIALLNGASILRVHDVAAARRTIEIYQKVT